MTEKERAAYEAVPVHPMEVYEHRNIVYAMTCKLEVRDLKRLTALLGKLTPADLKRVAAYAEGLAEWNETEQPSGDAPVP